MSDMSGSNIRTRIAQFTITDENGIQYIFKDLELGYVTAFDDVRQVLDENANSNIFNLPSLNPGLLSYSNSGINVVLGKANGQYVVNKWYLSQIVNPLTGKQITFTYSSFNEDILTDKSIQIATTSSEAGNVNVYWQRNKVQGLRLSSVKLSNTESLNFLYSPSPRIDLPGDNALSQVQVMYNNSFVYGWTFGYSYFDGVDGAVLRNPTDTYTSDEKLWSRLCLTTVQKMGQNGFGDPPYRFYYNLGGDNGVGVDVVPPMFSIYQDHFGYYNAGRFLSSPSEGSPTSFYTGTALRSLVMNFNGQGQYKKPLGAVSQNGILQSITVPTGGTVSYTYEPNSTQTMQLGGVRVKNMVRYDGISHTNDVVTRYNYLNDDEQTSSGWGGENYVYANSSTQQANPCPNSNTISPSVKDFAQNYIQNGFTTGVFGLAGPEVLDAAISSALEGMAVEIIVTTVIRALNSPNAVTTSYTIYSNRNMTANNPLPWGYSRTEAVNVLGTGNTGMTVYEFSNPTTDRPIDVPTLNVRYSNRPRYAQWAYGALKAVTVYDNQHKFVKRSVNNYNYIVNTIQDQNFLSKSWSANMYVSACGLHGVDPRSTMIDQETYPPFTGHDELQSTDELIYNSAQQSNTVTTHFSYNSNYQIKHRWFNNSKGEQVDTYYYYPADYPEAPGAIALMNASDNNMFNEVVSTETYITKKDGNTYMTGATATLFSQVANGDIKPTAVYSFQSTVPVPSTALQPFDNSDPIRDPNYYKLTALYSYDNNGNQVQSVTRGNKINCSIYDYDGKFPVATATNASYNDIGYSSFEAEGGKQGSWVNVAAIVSSDARTGNKCFNLSDGTNGSNGYFGFGGLNGSLKYIVSYWSKNGSPCITGKMSGATVFAGCQGGTGWKQGATVNGWTYYEVQVNNVDEISASGTGLIDEFRVFPQGSEMTTTTYAPMIGKTSECNSANKVIYYEYDYMGRLRFVKDDQKNIVKMYDYNYKQ